MKTTLVIATFLATYQLTFGQSELEYYSELLNEYKFEAYPVDVKCKIGPIPDSLIWGRLDELPTDIKSNVLIQFRNSDNYIGSCFKYAIWGCGSPCQTLAIFRVSSGELIGTLNSSLGFSTEPNSRLVLVNPPTNKEMDIKYRRIIGEPKFFELINGQILEAEK